MPRHTFVSRAKGPRVIRPLDGPARTLQPGQQLTAEVGESHLAYLQASGDFKITALEEALADETEVTGSGEPHPPIEHSPAYVAPDFDAMTDDQLRQVVAAKEGRQPHPATSRDKLLAKAKGE